MKTLQFQNKVLNGRFTQIPNDILYDNNISLQARFLFITLLSFAWTKEQVFPGKEKLAEIMGYSDDTIHKYLLELKEVGLVEWKRRGLNKTNIYTILDWSQYQAGTLKSRVQEPENLGFKNPSPFGIKNTKYKNTKRESIFPPLSFNEEEESVKYLAALTPQLIEKFTSFNASEKDILRSAKKCFAWHLSHGRVPHDWYGALYYWFEKEQWGDYA